ncbi:YbaB/EbfC family DNA-binding protein [Mycolicibacterium lacusdiani]|uniref:YbaB/EbfC family DNA-binding protein n=1 Tax=Mycolicibacterium lacusdiani TaxID=2895283 RepID=UPI001F2464AC|nr:YbaB/EbfC family DNA-binding protein [Mycolicibacterium lacusdiani]
MNDNSPDHFDDGPDDDHDALSALDFSAPDAGLDSDLAAFDEFVDHPAEAAAVADPVITERLPEVDDDGVPVPLFSVTNPPGTVTVTAFMDGRVSRIDLSPRVSRMSESQLADEVVVLARLATQDARSAQYEFMLEGMRQQGHDDASTRDFLSRDLELPSPEEADRERASVFATRYAGDDD